MIKFLVIHDVDGEEELEIMEAENATDALKLAGTKQMLFTREWAGKEVKTTAIHEIGNVNHLSSINKVFDLHRYYNERIKKLEEKSK
ncbi:hypothetical protein [Enterococcus sp. AZ102]|uniref:hypothetical protein n=1 Tax=Enterococcus sp. AZ102 TaxID=2774865 RepID=UPI003F262DA4